MLTRLTPEMLLYGYEVGVFPMAEDREGGAIHWYAPDPRAVLPLDRFHVSRNLRKLVLREHFEVQTDRAFEDVMRGCAARERTWISEEIVRAYTGLHHMGHAHSIECVLDGALVGGLYGVTLGGAFFGESMFHREPDASKVAMVHLVARLRAKGYRLLDTQFTTPHLERFGAIEIPRSRYEVELAQAIRVKVEPWDASFDYRSYI